MSDKNVGIAGTVIGAILILLSLRGDPALEIPGYICLAAGGILWLRGLTKERSARRISGALTALTGHEEELVSLLTEGVSLDQIAGDFHSRYGVSPDLMLIIAALHLDQWLTSDDPELRQRAERAIAAQKAHSTASPEVVLARLHEDGVALYHDQTALAFSKPPSFGGGVRGELILTPYYLYFLTTTESDLGFVREILGEVPLLSHTVVMADIAGGLQDEYQNPFTQKSVLKINERFKRAGSFAVPIRLVTKLAGTMTFVPNLCLEIEWQDSNGRSVRRWFDTKLREENATEEEQPRTWLTGWLARLRLVALAEGNNLYATPAKEAIYSFGGQNRTGAVATLDFVPVGQQRVIKWTLVAFAVMIAGFAIGGILSLNDMPVEGLATMFGGMLVFLGLAFFGTRRHDRAQAGLNQISAAPPEVLQALGTEGGLERLAREAHGRDGTPVARARLGAAQVLLGLAQSGDPDDRAEAQRMRDRQGGRPLPAPGDAVRAFVADETVYYGAEPASLLTGEEVSGALILDVNYVFFLAGADVESAVPSRGGLAFDHESIAGYVSCLSNAASLAIPLSSVTRLEMVEAPDIHVSIEWQPDAGALAYTASLRVGRGRPEDMAGRAGLWMSRIQLACAAQGNGLVWDEARPLLSHANEEA